MSVNIKNQRVSNLVIQLVEATGGSITDAVGQAVEEKLNQIKKNSSRQGIGRRLLALGEKCEREAPREWLTWDHDQEFYDDQGLPK